MLNRLVYFSERVCAERDIPDLVARSAARNKASNVTGMLLADDSCFIQILEGPRGAVSQLFMEIGRDPRHKAINLVEMTEIAAKSYPSWGMAYLSDPQKVDAVWHRVMRKRVSPWPLNAFQLRGLLKIALGDAIPGLAPARTLIPA